MMSMYAPKLVATPEKRARRYERDLDPSRWLHLTPVTTDDYGEIHRRACRLERVLRECMERELWENEIRARAKLRGNEVVRCWSFGSNACNRHDLLRMKLCGNEV